MAKQTRKLLYVGVFTLAACAHGPGRSTASSSQLSFHAATAEGVEVKAAVSAWDENNDGTRFTPIRVVLDNRSQRPLAIRPQLFALRGSSGVTYPVMAVPPNRRSNAPRHDTLLREAAYQPLQVYAPMSTGTCGQDQLTEAPYYAFSYVGPSLSTNQVFAYADDPSCAKDLPTPRMLAEALPGRTLAPGGHAEGFVYFPLLNRGDAPATVELELIDASTKSAFGRVAVPAT